MMKALVRPVSPKINLCELTFIERLPIDYDLAVKQHKNYCKLLKKCGAEVIFLTGSSEYPDACFIEDTALVFDELAVVASPGAQSRRGEVVAVAAELSKHREVGRISLPATLDGGDVLQIGKKVFVGQTRRTNAAGFNVLKKLLKPFDYEIIPINLWNCLHLKSAVTALNHRSVLVNPQWIEISHFAEFNVITVAEDEPWAANTIRVNDAVILHDGFSETIQLLRELDFKVESVNISEFLKAEAGLSCLSIRFDSKIYLKNIE